MNWIIVWTLLVIFNISSALQSCSDLDPYVDTSPGWQTITLDSGGTEQKYCAPQLPQTNYDSCEHALGMQSRFIEDDQMSASSAKDDDYEKYGGKYGRVGDGRSRGTGWVAKNTVDTQWLLVDTAQLSIVTMVTTGGRGWRGPNSYVTYYFVEHSLDGETYTSYERGEEEHSSSCNSACSDPYQFSGNTQQYALVVNTLTSPFLARYVKIIIDGWVSSEIAMRAELHGCRYSIAQDTSAISSARLNGSWYYDTSGGGTQIKYHLTQFDTPVDLDEALGMEDSIISDQFISASSTESGSSPAAARLNQAGGWTANVADANQYLIIDMAANRYVAMVSGKHYLGSSQIDVQGASASSYTETYVLASSFYGVTYTDYEYLDAQHVFVGNSGDGDTAVREYLHYPLFTRFIKISPQTYTGAKPSLRIELYGKSFEATDCDYWLAAGHTTPGFYYIIVTANPVTLSGVYCPFDASYTSCLDYKAAGETVDGFYWLYVGPGFPVYCELSSIENAAFTKISHDREGDVTITKADLSAPYGPGDNAHALTYSTGVAFADLAPLMAGEDFCSQSLYYRSTNAPIWSSGTQNTWWESPDDEQMLYWAGADPDGSSGCRCGQLGNCVDSSQKCNSDATTTQELSDGGYITDSSKLPVKTLKLGGFTASNTATYNIGKLECLSSSTTLPTSCLDAQSAGFTTSGYYLIDADGTGGPLKPLIVICDFDTVKNAVTMEVNHDFEGERQVDDYNDGGSFAKDIVYFGTYPALIDLVQGATSCVQYLGFKCSGTRIQQSGTQNTWWSSADGSVMDHWSGTTQSGMCACGAIGECYDDTDGCNCEDNSSEPKEDKGYITHASLLPVSQIRSGDTDSSNTASLTLGRLICYHRVGAEVKTCYDALQAGATDDGYYLLDPDSGGASRPFVAECSLNINSTHAMTTFNHDSESRTHVAGYSNKGSFIQSIVYEKMDVVQLHAQFVLPRVDYFQTCVQHIKYECYDAKLLMSRTSWWVSFKGETQSYWGGSNEQDGYCACGVNGTCHSANRKCNCDAEEESWLTDEGYVSDVLDEVLPVVQLRFGDTGGGAGSEEGYFTLGKLECHISGRSQ